MIEQATYPDITPLPHQPCKGLELLAVRSREIPHKCGHGGCPGDINRRKLEAFDKLLNVRQTATAATPLVSNQGQGLDGYSELANYCGILDRFLATTTPDAPGKGENDD